MRNRKILCRDYVVALLSDMKDKKPQRFTTLKRVIPTDSSLSNALHDLMDNGLVSTTVLKSGRRRVFGYKITPAGEKALELVRESERL